MSDYYEKYLKYKNKYIELKNIMGSGGKHTKNKTKTKRLQSQYVLKNIAETAKKENADREAELEHKCKNINDYIDMYPTCFCRQKKLTENYNECKKKWIGSTCILPTPLSTINQENQTKLPLAVECGYLGRVEKITYK
jgi:hypothetical protein